ncbi:MAG: hypothetical protein QXR09_00290 [Candidatus Aenigmatarchaeota archaeon]
MKRLEIAFISFTCDEGCSISFLELLNKKYREWKDLIDFKAFRLIQTREELSEIDVAFVEGVISTEKEKKLLEKIRKVSKKVVAVGSCAITGSPSNARNFLDKEEMEEIKPIMKKFGHMEKAIAPKNLVKIDEEVPGCPMLEDKMIAVIEKYLKEFGVLNAH